MLMKNPLIPAGIESATFRFVTQHLNRCATAVTTQFELINVKVSRMPRGCACPVLTYFSTLSHKRHDFRENVTEQERCVLIFSITLFEIFLSLRRIQRDAIINVHGL
jgi:hypothetical protein